MKKFIFFIAFLSQIYSCTNNEQAKHIQKLQKENELLKTGSLLKDSTITRFVRSFNQIINNLHSITETEKSIALKFKKAKKLQADDKNKILEDVKMINSLIAQNKSIATTMKMDFSTAKLNFSEFDSMLKNMQIQMEEKDAEINSLKQNLGDANVAFNTFDFTLDKLTSINVEMETKAKEQQAIIEQLQLQMNTAYYIFGNYKELKDAGVVAKSVLSRIENPLKNFNTSKFIKIDIRETKSIDIWNSSFRVITNHPSDSYKTVKNSLIITHPDEFWKLSKYLVVLKE